MVRCIICNSTFTISRGGRSSITKHNESTKHKRSLEAAASTQKVSSFFTNQKFLDDEKKVALAEGTFAYHTVFHNHSFRSMDCTSKILQNLYEKKFHCARTKCEAIIKYTFFSYTLANLQNDLEEARYVTLLSDASNHKAIKLYPILIRYFSFRTGVNIKILKLDDICGETSDILSNHIKKIIDQYALNDKIIALSADNTNTNFGGLNRKGENNVHKKLNKSLNKNIVGIGCSSHIVSNAINSAANLMTIDVEVIIPQIYLYFERYTVRVANLKDFCEEASVEYKNLLGYSKTRWLALMPAVERIIKLFEPLRSYFLSIEKCPKVIKFFFENDLAEVTLYFIHCQATIFHNTVLKIEGNNISCAEVNFALTEFKNQLQSRLEHNFVPITVNTLLTRLENSNPSIKQKFLLEVRNFYANSLAYLNEWTKYTNDFQNIQWILLKTNFEWENVQNTVSFLKEKFNVYIDDNMLFDEIRIIKSYCTPEKILEWNENRVKVEQKWLEIFFHHKNNFIPLENLKIIIEVSLCLPGTNASVERVFSMINDMWTTEKSRLTVESLSAMTFVKFNTNMPCDAFSAMLAGNEHLLKKIHASDKYT